MRKGQSYSLDLIVAVVIFLVIIAAFYTFINKERDAPTRKLQRNGEIIAVKLDAGERQHAFSLISEGRLNKTELDRLYNSSYDDLKREFGITSDFCIYLEDSRGKIIVIGNKTGIGNESLSVGGVQCGQPFNPGS
ncbi:MAG: hypothetical protein V1725_02675 [archaeon]